MYGRGSENWYYNHLSSKLWKPSSLYCVMSYFLEGKLDIDLLWGANGINEVIHEMVLHIRTHNTLSLDSMDGRNLLLPLRFVIISPNSKRLEVLSSTCSTSWEHFVINNASNNLFHLTLKSMSSAIIICQFKIKGNTSRSLKSNNFAVSDDIHHIQDCIYCIFFVFLFRWWGQPMELLSSLTIMVRGLSIWLQTMTPLSISPRTSRDKRPWRPLVLQTQQLMALLGSQYFSPFEFFPISERIQIWSATHLMSWWNLVRSLVWTLHIELHTCM